MTRDDCIAMGWIVALALLSAVLVLLVYAAMIAGVRWF